MTVTSESTAEDTAAEKTPGSALDTFEPAKRAEIEALVQRGLDEIAAGKRTFPELLAAIVGDRIPSSASAIEVPSVPEITQEHRDALVSIVELYGKVAPTEARLLTKDELTALAKERGAIDVITKFLGSRKDVGIREVVSNHFDREAEEKGIAHRDPIMEDDEDGKGEHVREEGTNTDSRGHYTLKQKVTAPDTGHRFERRTTESKPKVTSATIDKAYKAGKITRAEYLAMTEKPEVARALSEERMRKAIKKDPGLLFRLAEFADAGAINTSIYLVEDK